MDRAAARRGDRGAGGRTLFAQGQRQYSTAPPQLVSGSNVGFRVEGTDPRTGRPVGSWMLRIDGRWVEVGSAPLVKPAR